MRFVPFLSRFASPIVYCLLVLAFSDKLTQAASAASKTCVDGNYIRSVTVFLDIVVAVSSHL